VEIARLDTLVRNAVGADTARGDKVSVVNVAFDGLAAPAAEEAPDVWQRVSQAEKPLVAGAALVAILVAAFLVTRALKQPAPQPAAAVPALAAGAAAAGLAEDEAEPSDEIAALAAGAQAVLAAGDPARAALAAPAETALPPQIAHPVREQVVAIIEQRPEAAARVVRAWLKQD
jgi:flagellar M-ring protein FliF